VIVPVLIYLAFTAGTGYEHGWPIPTATDIAFALGVLAVFGRGLPPAIRVFLLALAILDDIVGIVLIAVLFATDLNYLALALAFLCVIAFAVLSRMLHTRAQAVVVIALIVLAIATWVLVLLSGVHATIAGVLLGLAMAQTPALVTRHALEPWINAIILPIFAFTAALVPIPSAGSGLSPVFWGIVFALPAGKLVGIAGAGWLGQKLFGGGADHPKLPLGDLLAVGALGGIGFTVSLLMNELAFIGLPEVADEGTLAVLLGSGIAIVFAGIAVTVRSRQYRAKGALGGPGGPFSR